MTDPVNPDANAENAAQTNSTNAIPLNHAPRSRIRKPAIWITLGILATAGVSSLAFARYEFGRHDGWHSGRHERGDRDGDRRYDRGGRNDDRRGWYHGPGQGIGHMGFGGFDMRFVDRVLVEVNASDEQRSKIRDIIRTARNDIEALQDRVPNTRKAMVEALGKPTVDRAALEAMQTERQKVFGEISKRMTQSIADVGDVLTPEQRANLATKVTRRWDDRRR